MSGSSAVASARRRRAEPLSQPVQQSVPLSSSGNQEAKDVYDSDSRSKQLPTPLQILQFHDKKIKEFEENLEGTIIEISKKVLSENLKHFNLDKPESKVKELDNTLILDKLAKFDELLDKFNELKTLVIKSNQISNESSIEMLKIKDKVLSVEEHILELEYKLKQSSSDENNIFNSEGNNAAEMLLRSMMQSSVLQTTEDGKLNIHDVDSDDESNDIGDVSEITLTESDLHSLNEEMKDTVLVEENIKLDNPVSDDKIEVSEDDEESSNKNNNESLNESLND